MTTPSPDLGTALANLDERDAALVGHLVDRAAADQRVELDRGLERALGQLPRLLRGPARAILFG